MIKCHVVDPEWDGFSVGLFAFLIYYFEVGDVGMQVVV